MADQLCRHQWLPEREHVGLDPAGEEGDLESAVADRSAPANQLIEPLLSDRSVALLIDVKSMLVARRLSVDKTRNGTEAPRSRGLRTRCTSRAWKRNASCPFVAIQDRRPLPDRPIPGESPFVQIQLIGRAYVRRSLRSASPGEAKFWPCR